MLLWQFKCIFKGIGRLRKKGGKNIDLTSLLQDKFFETLHTFIYYPYQLRQGNSEFFA